MLGLKPPSSWQMSFLPIRDVTNMKRNVFVLILAFLLTVLAGCSSSNTNTSDQPAANTESKASAIPSVSQPVNQESRQLDSQLSGGRVKVHFLDVGQADSIFVHQAAQNYPGRLWLARLPPISF